MLLVSEINPFPFSTMLIYRLMPIILEAHVSKKTVNNYKLDTDRWGKAPAAVVLGETLKMMIQKMNENHQSKSELSARSAPSGMARQDSGGTLQRKRSYRSSEEIVNSAGEHRKLSSTGTNQSFDGGTGSNKMTTATALTHQQQQETNSPIEYQQQQSCSSLLSNGASSTSTLQSSVDHRMNHSYNNTSTNGNDVTQTVASSHNSYRSATEDWAFISNYNTR